MKIHRNIHIEGRVQKVGFRYYTHQVALAHELTGFVMNQRDGSVYTEVEGEENQVMAFFDWCRQGPSMAEVTKITCTEGTLQGFTVFEIRH
jgi:acylphosphatase